MAFRVLQCVGMRCAALPKESRDRQEPVQPEAREKRSLPFPARFPFVCFAVEFMLRIGWRPHFQPFQHQIARNNGLNCLSSQLDPGENLPTAWLNFGQFSPEAATSQFRRDTNETNSNSKRNVDSISFIERRFIKPQPEQPPPKSQPGKWSQRGKPKL